ncbi:MAG: DUF551 domain-containing protein [Lachnospiraceae bacterium]|nr:DUF551 domain-containing protein [Lachnospiraceae bacterium]
MSMISEQVNELRYKADIYNTVGSVWELNRAEAKRLQAMLRQAADTIESLSAKLQAANMEQTKDCVRWIPCSERLPEIEQTVLLSLRSLDVYIGFRANTEGYFYSEGEGYVLHENVLAWRIPPEPYHEP